MSFGMREVGRGTAPERTLIRERRCRKSGSAPCGFRIPILDGLAQIQKRVEDPITVRAKSTLSKKESASHFFPIGGLVWRVLFPGGFGLVSPLLMEIIATAILVYVILGGASSRQPGPLARRTPSPRYPPLSGGCWAVRPQRSVRRSNAHAFTVIGTPAGTRRPPLRCSRIPRSARARSTPALSTRGNGALGLAAQEPLMAPPHRVLPERAAQEHRHVRSVVAQFTARSSSVHVRSRTSSSPMRRHYAHRPTKSVPSETPVIGPYSLPPLVFVGVALGLVITPVYTTALAGVPERRQSQANAILRITQQLRRTPPTRMLRCR